MKPAATLRSLAANRPQWLRSGGFLLGAATTLSFAPFGWYPLTLLLPLPLFVAFGVLDPVAARRAGFAYGAGLFLAGTYWLYNSIHVIGQAPLLLAIFLMLGLVLIMAIYYGAAGWLIARYTAGHWLAFLLAMPSLWVSGEWLRGWFLSGFPWMTFGYSLIDSPLAGYAPLGGVYLVSLAISISIAAIATLSLAPSRYRALLVAVALLPWLGGYLLDDRDWTEPAGPPLTAAVVQGGVPQDRKWLPEQFEDTLVLYRRSLADVGDASIVVWPEVALPAVLDRVEGYVQGIERQLTGSGKSLLFGILERDLEQQRVYNSIVAIDGQRRQVYRKRHLVPFGEYFPVPDFVREWMRLMNLPYSDISPGDAVQPLIETPGGQRLAVAICYEDAYGAEQLFALPEATLLINISNDAWFGDSIAPHQHLQIARMRAREAGRYVVRATNDGVSAFIDARGDVYASGPQFEYVALQQEVVPMQGLTPYGRFGNTPALLLCFVMLLAAGASLRTRN